MFKFHKINDFEIVASLLAKDINRSLRSNESVLWLVSGGSVISLAQAAAKLIDDSPLLTISLVDERWGLPGHKDSNWEQLDPDGFGLKHAKLVPVLHGQTARIETDRFSRFLDDRLKNSDYKLGLFGLGADGHTAGILANSPAINSDAVACRYSGADYERITLTPNGISQLNEAIVYATGPAKLSALNDLRANLPINLQPAQVLKRIPLVTVYNDQVGEKT